LFFSGQRLVRFTCIAAAVQEGRKRKNPPLKFVPFIFVFYLRASLRESRVHIAQQVTTTHSYKNTKGGPSSSSSPPSKTVFAPKL
jgi:hypothetical protein